MNRALLKISRSVLKINNNRNIVKQACLSQHVRFSSKAEGETAGHKKSNISKEWTLTKDLSKIMEFKSYDDHHSDIQQVKQDMLRHLLATYHNRKRVPVEF